MKLLLDTHIFLWGFLEPERIPETVARELEESSNELWLSPISIWESLVLAAKKRVELKPDPESWVRRSLRELGSKEAPVTVEVAIVSRKLDIEAEDPADRFLAATAAVFDLTLVTADASLRRGTGFRVLSAL